MFRVRWTFVLLLLGCVRDEGTGDDAAGGRDAGGDEADGASSGGAAGGAGGGAGGAGGGSADAGGLAGAGGSEDAGGSGAAGGAGGSGAAGGGGAGGAVEDACAVACAHFVDCSVELCADYADADRAAIEGLCRAACDTNPSFPVVAGGIETCEDLVSYGRQSVAGDYAVRCPAGPPVVRQHPECAVFGRRVAECSVETCAPVADHVEIFAVANTAFCDQAVANGEANPEQIARAVGPETPCENPFLAQIVRSQVVDDPNAEGDGYLAAFCQSGPFSPVETCRDACAVIAPCIAEDAENAYLREADRCVHLCLSVGNPRPESWACTAELEIGACGAVGPCFAPPMVAACVPYADRLAACTAAACEPIAPFAAGLADQLVAYCNGEVAAQRLDPDQLADIGAETPCDDPRLGPLVTTLTQAPGEDGMGGGPLGPLCRDGLPRPVERCDLACEHLGPCIPDDGEGAALRDLEACRYFCATNGDVPEPAWQCLERADGGCPQVLSCVGG